MELVTVELILNMSFSVSRSHNLSRVEWYCLRILEFQLFVMCTLWNSEYRR